MTLDQNQLEISNNAVNLGKIVILHAKPLFILHGCKFMSFVVLCEADAECGSLAGIRRYKV